MLEKVRFQLHWLGGNPVFRASFRFGPEPNTEQSVVPPPILLPGGPTSELLEMRERFAAMAAGSAQRRAIRERRLAKAFAELQKGWADALSRFT
jgi:hypothetical protein